MFQVRKSTFLLKQEYIYVVSMKFV